MSSNNSFIAAVRRVFLNASGRLRIIWLLAAVILVWHIISFGTAYLLSRLMLRMFDSWGVANSNIVYAPYWVQLLASYQPQLISAAASIIAAILAACTLRYCCGIRLKPTANSVKSSIVGAFTGILLPMLLMAIFLVCDSMRVTRPVPAFSSHILLTLPFSAMTAAAEILAAFGCIRISAAGCIGRIPGHLAAAISFCLMNIFGFGTVLSAVNSLLIGLVLSLVSEKYGLAGCAALRCGWLWAVSAIAGFPESSYGLFTLYPVSENLITGGYSGPEAGLAVTIICFAVCMFTLAIPEIKKHRKSPDGR